MKISNKKRGIVSLVIVLSVGILSFGMAVALTNSTVIGLKKNRNLLSTVQSFYTAEAAVHEGTYQYLGEYLENSGLEPTYTGASFNELNNKVSSSTISVASYGTHSDISGMSENSTHRIITQRVITFPEGFAFAYAIYAENDLALGGSANIEGNIFANGDIDFTGANAEIDGDAFASGSVEDSGNVNGESSSDVDPIPAPQIDSTPYFDQANIDGTYFADRNNAEAYLNGETRFTVIYVDDGSGETHIQGNTTNLTGSLVVVGDLSINGGTFTGADDYVAVLVYGDLSIKGGATINGVVYVTGATAFGAGNNTINGSLISAGGVTTDISGDTTIVYNEDIAVDWEDVEGLDTTSASAPEVVWSEG